MNSEDYEKWFEGIWADREDTFYPKFFGPLNKVIYKIPDEIFTEHFSYPHYNPQWLTHIVIESEPNELRNSWLYVTSALSNPWGQDPETINSKEFSGMGFEMVMESPIKAPWVIDLLHKFMAYQILVASGVVQGNPFEFDSVIPFFYPLYHNSILNHVAIVEPDSKRCTYPSQFQLRSGTVDLFLLVGLGELEVNAIEKNGGSQLMAQIKEETDFPVTDPNRPSLI